MSAAEIVEAFMRAGNSASYHYADDSTKEWGKGRAKEAEALAIFDAHPELEAEFRALAAEFLWSLNQSRPPKVSS